SVSIVVAEEREGQPVNVLVEARVHLRHGSRASSQIASTPPTSKARTGEQVHGDDEFSHVYRVEVSGEGIYQMTAQQLRDAGIPTDAATAASIKMYGNGGRELSERVEPPFSEELRELPIMVITTPQGDVDHITFYAGGVTGIHADSGRISHYLHHYDTRASYLLTVGGSPGRRAAQRSAASGPADERPLVVRGLVFQEEEVVNPYNGGSGRRWYGRSIENGGSMMLSLDVPGLVRSGTVDYRLVVAHRGTSASGVCTVMEQGTTVAQRSIPMVPKYMDTYPVPLTGSIDASAMSPDQRSVVRIAYESSQRTSTGILDWIEIEYPRGLVAHNQDFDFVANPGRAAVMEYTINGFEGGSTLCFDVTDPTRPELVENVAPQGGLFSIRESFTPDQIRRYYLSSRRMTPSIQRIEPLSLRSRARNGQLGQVLVITHPGQRASAERYAEYRRATTELTVSVIGVDEIFREFSYGMVDPTALRDMIRYAYRNSPVKPGYVLLWGDGHYDYKGISTATPNWVIPYESLDPNNTSYGLWTFTTDDYFARVEGNDPLPDVAIGRLPITSNAIGDRMIAKIRAYESTSATDDWRTRVTLIADDGPTSEGSDGTTHLRQSERLWSDYLPLDMQAKKIYMVEYPTENIARGRRKPAVTAAYISTINTTGTLLLNWIGHGNPRVWAHEFIFERETTPSQMNNPDKLFFLTAATCDFARFDLTDAQSGAEDLVLRDGGGAIGVFSASRVVLSDANAAINQDFYETMFRRGPNGSVMRLGDVIMDVKQRFYGPNDEKFFLLGDPTVRLLIPQNRLVFDRINGDTVGTQPIQLKALQTVTVEGSILEPTSNQPDASFNGTATITLLDAVRTVTVLDDDINSTPNTFRLPGATISKGSYEVVNGRFVATFVVPKDVAFSQSTARMYGFAASTDQRSAIGATDQVIVDGVVDATFDDTEGPEIRISL
ncbi:MAG: type IX secretion system sortase PorU, partial [Candidatus Kapaibacteriota bacterium]